METSRAAAITVVLAIVMACARAKGPPAPMASEIPSAPSASASSSPSPPPVVASSPEPPPSSSPPAAGPPPTADPIACKNVDECWFDDAYKPMKRPAKLRGKKIAPCKNGEHAPACVDGVCVVRAYKC